MYQRWSELSFLHWPFPPDAIRPFLPPGLDLDTFEDRAYVGLVPFTMTGVRPVWSPPFAPLSNFHETNVRTYVHYQGRNPGVWFFSLDAANVPAVRIARALWKLPYHFARMRLETANGEIDYTSERLWPAPVPATCSVRTRPVGSAAPALVGTLEHFLAERYILYAYKRSRLYSGQVHHTPYPLQRAELLALDESLLKAANLTRPDMAPLVHYAGGVDVRIFPLRPIASFRPLS
ncbi:MAG: hypothetical protein JWL77_71 [Chthonomonadaceae bacterium]|nr:hypothetical protein [Chthonomonadaceae bacterium]